MTTNASFPSIILFDGVCNFCDASVQFIYARDPKAKFGFAPLQSDFAKARLEELAFDGKGVDSVMLIENGKVYTHSTAALKIAQQLSFPWPLFAIGWVVPRPLRDAVYNFIAKNRYRWFGKKEHCMMPTPALKSRFLDK